MSTEWRSGGHDMDPPREARQALVRAARRRRPSVRYHVAVTRFVLVARHRALNALWEHGAGGARVPRGAASATGGGMSDKDQRRTAGQRTADDALAVYGAAIVRQARAEKAARQVDDVARRLADANAYICNRLTAMGCHMTVTLAKHEAARWAETHPAPRIPVAPSAPWWRILLWAIRGGDRRLMARQVRTRMTVILGSQ